MLTWLARAFQLYWQPTRIRWTWKTCLTRITVSSPKVRGSWTGPFLPSISMPYEQRRLNSSTRIMSTFICSLLLGSVKHLIANLTISWRWIASWRILPKSSRLASFNSWRPIRKSCRLNCCKLWHPAKRMPVETLCRIPVAPVKCLTIRNINYPRLSSYTTSNFKTLWTGLMMWLQLWTLLIARYMNETS